MSGFFSPDSPLMQLITKVVSSVYLNILWLICCLPVVTAGASTTALFYVTLQIARNEEGHLTRAFFRSFRENFRQSTLVWLILLAVGAVLGVDGYILYHLRYENIFWTLGAAVFIVAAAAYLIILMYIFPLMARFRNTTAMMFKNALFIGMRFLICTALMALIYFAMAVIVIRIFTPLIIFGEGLCALLCSALLKGVLAQCEEPKEEHDDSSAS